MGVSRTCDVPHGKHRDCGSHERSKFCRAFVVIIHVALLPTFAFASTSDGDALKTFIMFADLSGKSGLFQQWVNEDPCTNGWLGVMCTNNGTVMSVVLDGFHLGGIFAPNSLGNLTDLKILRLNGNGLTGEIPIDLGNCGQLKQLYLMSNRLSGSVPNSLSHRLQKIYLSDNMLVGNIPQSFAQFPGLLSLRLENNHLTGPIPPFTQTSLTEFNVSHNRLEGEIPAFLSKSFGSSAYLGNAGLCGQPLAPCGRGGEDNSGTTTASKSLNLSHAQIIAVVVADIFFLLALMLGYIYYSRRKSANKVAFLPSSKVPTKSVEPSLIDATQSASISMEDADKAKLVYFKDAHSLQLDDLLKAWADFLGKGILGVAYRAVMEDGSSVCVKRLKELHGVGKFEFEKQMQQVGKLKHPNVVPLWAYYYSKDEKLLVYEYMPNGNLLTLLHAGKHGIGSTRPLLWNARLRVARGVANGLAFLHQEFKFKQVPHGNLKASNVLIDNSFEARISDFGFAPLLTNKGSGSLMVGYTAPEYARADASAKISVEADVYCFGVLLLELLTGRISEVNMREAEDSSQEIAFNLSQWVLSVVREEWTAEVFDRILVTTGANEESLVSTLQIAMACIHENPHQRPQMSEVHKLIADIKLDEYIADSASVSREPGMGLGAHEQQLTSFESSTLMGTGTPFSEGDQSFCF